MDIEPSKTGRTMFARFLEFSLFVPSRVSGHDYQQYPAAEAYVRLAVLPGVADAYREGACDVRVVERILCPADAHPRAQILRGENGERPALALAQYQLSGRHGADTGRLVSGGGCEPVLRGEDHGLEVRQRVVEPAAERAAELYLIKAVLYRVSDGDHRVGVVLLGAKALYWYVGGERAGIRVEIADEQVGSDAAAQGVFIAEVAGDYKIARCGPWDRREVPSGYHDTFSAHFRLLSHASTGSTALC